MNLKISNNEWIYFGIAHDSKKGNGDFFILSREVQNNISFSTNYEYDLRKFFQIFYGAYSKNIEDIKQGLIGDIGPLFYASDYLQNLPYYWMHNYYEPRLIKTNYIRVEYAFDRYKEDKRLSEDYEKMDGLIEGRFNYTHKGGAIFYGKSGIKVNGNLTPITEDKANSLCVYIAFHYEEPLYDEFILFRRGKVDEKGSFEVILRNPKGRGTNRIVVIKAYFDEFGRMSKREFSDNSLEISPKVRNEIQACFATGLFGLNNAAVYINGKTKIFENQVGEKKFDWNLMGKENRILDLEMAFSGNIKFDLITISEGSGGVIYRAEKGKKVRNKELK